MDYKGGIDRIQCWPGPGQHTPGDFHSSAFRRYIIKIIARPFYYWICRSDPLNNPFADIQKKISVIQAQAVQKEGGLFDLRGIACIINICFCEKKDFVILFSNCHFARP